MGYTTTFTGHFTVEFQSKETRDSTVELVNGLASTRRMKRNLIFVSKFLPHSVDHYGVEGEFFYPTEKWPWWKCCGQGKDPSVMDVNVPPSTQPSLWLQWVMTRSSKDQRAILKWDGNEKFYRYIDWLQYLIDRIFIPVNAVVNGRVKWEGEDPTDLGVIQTRNNEIIVTEL